MTVETKVKLPSVAAFICANCARAGLAPAQRRTAPLLPTLPWTVRVKEVPVPCAGRVQPEHILKAFEAGADIVCILGCKPGNCHYAEGSLRGQRRIDYVAQLLNDLGLDGRRAIMFYLPGSAREDMAAALGNSGNSGTDPVFPGTSGTSGLPGSGNTGSVLELPAELAEIAREVSRRADLLGLSPLHMDLPWKEPTDAAYEMEEIDVAED